MCATNTYSLFKLLLFRSSVPSQYTIPHSGDQRSPMTACIDHCLGGLRFTLVSVGSSGAAVEPEG